MRIKRDKIEKLITGAIGLTNGENYNPTQVVEELSFNFMSNEDAR